MITGLAYFHHQFLHLSLVGITKEYSTLACIIFSFTSKSVWLSLS